MLQHLKSELAFFYDFQAKAEPAFRERQTVSVRFHPRETHCRKAEAKEGFIFRSYNVQFPDASIDAVRPSMSGFRSSPPHPNRQRQSRQLDSQDGAGATLLPAHVPQSPPTEEQLTKA